MRHAPGVRDLVSGCFLMARQIICPKPVKRKVRNISGKACTEYSGGKAHNKATHSLTSPAPTPPFAHAKNRNRLANHRSGVPGKCATSPAIRSGSEYQLGICLLRKSYRLMARIKLNNQSMVVHHMVVYVWVYGKCRLEINDSGS